MNIDSIRDRTIDNQLLNFQEMNVILNMLRGLTSGSMQERNYLGNTILPDRPYIGTINVKFDQYLTYDIPPYSVFPLIFNGHEFLPYIATADFSGEGESPIFCTNGPFPLKTGSKLDCFIVGDDTPRLVHYTLFNTGSVVPQFGDKVQFFGAFVGGSDTILAVETFSDRDNKGHFVCVSEPDTTTQRIWVLRTYLAKDDVKFKPLMLMRAHDWMDVGCAVEVSIWNFYSDSWEPDAALAGGEPVASAIAQDVGNRNFLKPSDLCWGRFLGTTKSSSSSDDDSVDVYEIIGENGLHQTGKAMTPVDCGQSADFEITCGDPEAGSPGEYFPEDKDIDMEDLSANDYLTLRKQLNGESVACPGDIKKHTIEACTPSKGCVRHIFEGEFAKLRYITSNRKWEARPVPDTLFAKGTLYAEMCPENDGQIQGLQPYGCCAGQQTVTIPNGTALNTSDFKLAGKTGYNVFAVYSGVGNTWMIIQVLHEEVELLEDVISDIGTSDDCPSVSGKKRKFALMTCVPEPEPFDLLTFEKMDAITGITLGTCGLELEKTSICVAAVGASSAGGTVDFQQVEVVTNVFAGPDCSFTIDKKLVCVAGSLGASPSLATLMTVDVDVVTSFEVYDTSGDLLSAPDDGGTCQVLAKTKTIKVCAASTESPFALDVITFELQSLLYNVYDDGEDIIGCWLDIFVPCVGGSFCDVVIPVDPCPPEGSGTPEELIMHERMLREAEQLRIKLDGSDS